MKLRIIKIYVLILICLILFCFIYKPCFSAEIKVNTEDVIRKIDRHKILGVNIAVWNSADTFKNPKILKLFKDFKPAIIRIPGGSMSDVYFWNGNGVREGNNTPDCIDWSKYKAGAGSGGVGLWDIDFSDWKPGFIGYEGFPKDLSKAEKRTWHGNSDVKDHLDFIKLIGAEALICVNTGTGTPKLAAEWVKWANKKMGYNVKYWEIGNELEGGWEAGHIRPDGTEMTGKMYAEIFKKFAIAMKKVDPNIKIGGPTCGSSKDGWVKELLEHAGDYVDYITYHDYYTSGAGSIEDMFNTLPKIKEGVNNVRENIQKYQPDRADKIEIGITEYNSKLHEDIHTADLFNGLWIISALGEMLESDMDIATLWDGFTQKQDTGGGHGFILEEEKEPKGDYWAMNIYHRYFGDTILNTSSDTGELKAYSSKNKKGEVFLIVINIDQKNPIKATINIENTDVASIAEYARFSRFEYRWEPLKFFPTWNFGPSKMNTSVNNSFEFEFPPFTAIAFKFIPKKSVEKLQLKISGPEETVITTKSKIELKAIAMDSKGNPLKSAKIKISTTGSKLKISKKEYKTDNSGKIKIEITAPSKPAKEKITLKLKDLSLKHSIRVVKPKLQIIAPEKVPLYQPVKVIVLACYGKGNGKPLENFNETCKLTGTGKEIEGKFNRGLAVFNFTIDKAKTYDLKVTTKSKTESSTHKLEVFEEKEMEKLILQFNDEKDMERIKGNGKFKIDYNIRPNQGVFSINLDGFQGWQQDFWNMEGFDRIKEVNWAKVVGLTFDLMVPEDFDTGDQWANLVYVLQSSANWWMPLKEVPLSGMEKGKWQRIKVMIEKPEHLEAMKAFLKIIVVFNSEGTLKGNIYIDNLAFIEKVAK